MYCITNFQYWHNEENNAWITYFSQLLINLDCRFLHFEQSLVFFKLKDEAQAKGQYYLAKIRWEVERIGSWEVEELGGNLNLL